LLLAACGGGGGKTPGGKTSSKPGGKTFADLDVDSNRNGSLTDDAADDDFEDQWNQTHGAVFYFNIDDDNSNDLADHGESVKTAQDVADLTPVVARHMSGLPSGGSAKLVLNAAAQGRIRMYIYQSATPTQMSTSGGEYDIPLSMLGTGDVIMAIEGNTRLSPTWNGQVTLTLEIRNSGGAVQSSDVIQLRQAPPIFATNLWTPTQVQVVLDNLPGVSNNSALIAALTAATTAAGITLVQVPGAAYNYDRWIQDSHEPGVHLLPVNGAPRRSVVFNYQCLRNRQIDAWVVPGLIDPDQGVLADFGIDDDSLSYGGNVEIVPPHNGRAWGRALIGGGNGNLVGTTTPATDYMDTANRQWFDANPIMGPHVQATTEWLAVGHIDEYTMFIPAPNTARGYVCMIASPMRAWNQLVAMNGAGGGANVVFQGRTTYGWQTTVGAIVGNGPLGTLQQQVQARIDQGRNEIKAATGLTDADFIELPVLFEHVGGGYLAAYNPGVVNMVCLPAANGTTYLIIPDPEGPIDAGGDIWQQDILAQINPLFTAGSPVNIAFTDVFYSYHDLLGEAHCGTNTIRIAPDDDWWDK
jgi:protein-arginine deiminase